MTTVLCTLYNSLYLDKGLVLYDSLCECAKDFKLYVLCMDDKCYEVLTDLHQERHIPVRLSDFEEGDEALLAAKANRSMGEYCWTCSSSFIRYILKHYGEDSCTYIDADMFFYNDPQVLINEMLVDKKSVMVVPHRFPEDNKELAKTVGTYCVEFNTFLNTPESLEVLEYWRGRCLECCSNLGDGIHWGDQKYLDELVDIFSNIHICQDLGAGIAPWNFSIYKDGNYSNTLVVQDSDIKPVFIHFQGITYLSRKRISSGVSKKDVCNNHIIKTYYYPYIEKLDKKKRIITSRYNIEILFSFHPSKTKRLWKLRSSWIGLELLYLYRTLFSSQVMIKLR